jgi:hypothetical protein
MLKIVRKGSNNKYNGTVVVTDNDVNKIERTFSSKFEAFTFGIEQNWTKKCVMKYCLQTENNQYFHNYLIKYRSNENK